MRINVERPQYKDINGESYYFETVKSGVYKLISCRDSSAIFLVKKRRPNNMQSEIELHSAYELLSVEKELDYWVMPHPGFLELDVEGNLEEYLVYDYFHGNDLKYHLNDEIFPGESNNSTRNIVEYIRKVFVGLSKQVHGDIKLENLMVDENGLPGIIDPMLTNNPAGSPGYINLVRFDEGVSRVADLIALGVVAYELLTGKMLSRGILNYDLQHWDSYGDLVIAELQEEIGESATHLADIITAKDEDNILELYEEFFKCMGVLEYSES